jgi:hypothetical protein
MSSADFAQDRRRKTAVPAQERCRIPLSVASSALYFRLPETIDVRDFEVAPQQIQGVANTLRRDCQLAPLVDAQLCDPCMQCI